MTMQIRSAAETRKLMPESFQKEGAITFIEKVIHEFARKGDRNASFSSFNGVPFYKLDQGVLNDIIDLYKHSGYDVKYYEADYREPALLCIKW